MSTKILSNEIHGKADNHIVRFKTEGWHSRLVSIKIDDNPTVDLYVRIQKSKAEKM